MNYTMLKDVKTMIGFFSSIIGSIIAIFLAAGDSDVWVVFIVLSLILLALSVTRASRLYNQKST
ncbi:hypothetical protein BN988_02008 [Oceanobacillus picturae]|uniref:Uncharacterized protein n=1 Tax=Oceanobacillus picturae TaxID=171693 RepID=W9AKR1_9BACI|nr:hypothetical protein [Oceanobacillus picturae]RIU88755.1 hypothetical protein D1864_17285 [Oceanobacillus picturae]CDO03492.1 hypothetical protein BN988_02008 [Oceanobacillus picturae]